MNSPLKQILKHIYEGKKIKMTFGNHKQRENFRVRLYKAKQEEDRVLTDILEEDRQILKCELRDSIVVDGKEINSSVCEAIFWLEKKPTETQFDFEVVEDDPT